MVFKMGKRGKTVRFASFCIAALLVITGAFAAGYNTIKSYRTAITNTYQQSLSQLSDYFSSLETTLTKGIYANTISQQYGLAGKLMVQSESAKTALSSLPAMSPNDEEQLQKYLTQVSDYSSFIMGTLSRGEKLSDDNIDAMEELAKYADRVAPSIENLAANFAEAEQLESLLESSKAQNSSESTFANTYVTGINENFADYPTLLYDGPFADAVQQKEPRLTAECIGYTADDAKNRAAEFLNISTNEITFDQTRKGTLPCHVFKGDGVYCAVTVKGGFVSEMYRDDNQQQGAHTLGGKECVEQAQIFLKQKGMDNMAESYYITANDVCTINFAYKQDEYICYGDLIKVGVSTKTGNVVSYDAKGYIMNHYDREIKKAKLNQTEAQKSLSKRLTVNSEQNAVIPTGGLGEVQCVEFTCTGENNDRVIVYINEETGLEEQIYIMLQSDKGGTLVM